MSRTVAALLALAAVLMVQPSRAQPSRAQPSRAQPSRAQPSQAQPRLVPDGDVDVLYRVSGAALARIPGGAPGGVRLQWDAAGERLRSEPVGGAVYAITDLGRHVADVVFAGQNTVLELPLRGGSPQALLSQAVAGADAQFTRGAPGQVLGLACTEWRVHGHNLDATACVTADGVVLRAAGRWQGEQGELVAQSVTRGTVAADRFVPPAGAVRIAMGHPK